MQNVVVNMCETFHNDRLRNDGALGNGKSDNNNKKKNDNNVLSAWRPVPGSKNLEKRKVLKKYDTCRKCVPKHYARKVKTGCLKSAMYQKAKANTSVFRPGNGSPSATNVVVVLLLVVVIRFSIS